MAYLCQPVLGPQFDAHINLPAFAAALLVYPRGWRVATAGKAGHLPQPPGAETVGAPTQCPLGLARLGLAALSKTWRSSCAVWRGFSERDWEDTDESAGESAVRVCPLR